VDTVNAADAVCTAGINVVNEPAAPMLALVGVFKTNGTGLFGSPMLIVTVVFRSNISPSYTLNERALAGMVGSVFVNPTPPGKAVGLGTNVPAGKPESSPRCPSVWNVKLASRIV